MPYCWLEDMALADEAFEAWADTPEALLAECGEAVLELMAVDPGAVARRVRRDVQLEDEPDLLLLRLLQSVIWYKDAEQLFLHVGPVVLTRAAAAHGKQGQRDGGERWTVSAELWGEEISAERHQMGTDVKAVTLHQLSLRQDPEGTWRARVVLDV